jgi:hypothetical protein
VCLGAVSAQTTGATFNRQQFTAQPSVRKMLSVDLNNDGLPDLVLWSEGQSAFSVMLANADASFQSPVAHAFAPITDHYWTSLATADFNRDGKADIVVANATNTITIFYGDGSGGFQPVQIQTSMIVTDLIATDFNSDGKPDILIMGAADLSAGPSEAQLLVNNGDGTFTPGLEMSGNVLFAGPILGDFDGDGNPDVAVSATSCDPVACETFIWVLYGDGHGGFSIVGVVDPTSNVTPGTDGALTFGAGDVDKDGRTDLVAPFVDAHQSPTSGTKVFYGQADRTFRIVTRAAPIGGTPIVADFDSNGLNDIAVDGIDIYYDIASGSTATDSFAVAPDILESQFVVGDFNKDGRPDIAVVSYESGTLTELLNTTATGTFAYCASPVFAGIHVCGPKSGSAVNSPFMVNATTKLNSWLYRFELYLDGTKVRTVREDARLFSTVSAAPGKHTLAYIARNNSGTEKYVVSESIVVSGCLPPTTEGIHVCSPANGSTVTGPSVPVDAAANISGTIYRFELWVDSVKKVSVAGSANMATSVSLAAGAHRFDFVARNTTGERIVKTVQATVH